MLSIVLNAKSKLTLERGTNLINRNTRVCQNVHYRHPQQGKMQVISWIVSLLWSEIMGGYNTPDTMVEIGA